jgi:nickel/cobalt exporter
MIDIAGLLQQGAGNIWLFIPSAILLGALHGLEPGHSKTMMAAFIVAIRGTVSQAVSGARNRRSLTSRSPPAY